MPRIIVVTDPSETREPTVVLEELLLPAHIAARHYSDQLVERIGWAVMDAERLETGADRTAPEV